CGLLHKIGKIILLDSLGKSYAVLLKECEDYPDDGRVSERETSELGFNHQDVGAILADRWSLPNAIVDAIQLHGQPISKLGGRLHVHVIAVASRAAAFVLKGDRAAAQMVLLQEGDELGLDPRIARTLLDRLDHESSEAA
ncbi:MAG: HDOD domain-containing protein, partial [Planctomycetes bacterium]|nr:HDOD domain-containing protein [Planctomycetota bacterium]